MKKFVAILLAALLALSAVSAFAETAAVEPLPIKLGQVVTYLHGHGFAVVTAVVQGETIQLAKIDEFQFMGDREDVAAVGVPVGEETISQTNAETGAVSVLGSKRVNSDLYSLNMQRAGSTTQIAASYNAIEKYVAGKTIAELEAATADVEKAAFVDAVSGATLADSLGYVQGIIAAAKAASNVDGTYTFYNKTGEKVVELFLIDNQTGEKGPNYAVNGFAPDAKMVITRTFTAEEKAAGSSMTISFKTESGREAQYGTLYIEEAPITLLAADDMTGATPISFRAPAAE